MSHKAIVMFSGGLDSILAICLLKDLGVDVHAFHNILDVHPGTHSDKAPDSVKAMAEQLGVPLLTRYEPDTFWELVKHPQHGYGKNLNPCIDCRLFTLALGGDVMREIGAEFIATGEVVGERPMSQNRNTMRMIEKRSGLEGLILRPLCAKLLPPTIPEEKGWVDREKLLDISGRGRTRQMELAAHYGITEYPSPAGGCLLTDPGFSRRLQDLLDSEGDVESSDVKLLKVGRHFRLDGGARAVVGRTHGDNQAILTQLRPGDRVMRNAEVAGPVTLVRGKATDEALRQAAALTARYGQARDVDETDVNCREVDASGEQVEEPTVLTVKPAGPEELRVERIG